ncbi:MAG: xylulokinase [Chloroflexi bacterium]|nr:xylulokinase [Chloroflexota bacterium]MCY3582706.1 xylulokinase [Chloroflexota bacterium]MCY3715204.1 xylulokinase [Chloroflexota bacterium]MDE2649975.1 xylulokinase [Chloroflexota bacterium]MXX84739.1 xylulokinase [Chloroflexota bacterium]
MPYLMGLDISTTSAKALILDQAGAVVAIASTPQPISQPQALWSEQNPADWWAGIRGSIRAALADSGLSGVDIAAIGLTGQMHGLTLLDETGEPLRPAILWNDQRTQAQCDYMTAVIGADRLLALTGNPAVTGFTAPKLLWVRDHEPQVYARAAQILLPKDYIRYKLTDTYATDLAGAAGTSLLNVAERAWSSEVLAALDIPVEWLPPVHEGTAVTSVISAGAAAETGLRAGTPVVGGGGDQAAGAIGMGCVTPDTIGVTVGTSGVVFAPLANYAYEPQGRLHAFCHAVPGTWHLMGVMLSAAGSLQWYRDTFAPGLGFDALLGEAAQIPAGSEGLFFLPYLTGERTPHPDPLARGAFIGMTSRHSRGHLTRALLEGVAFALKDSFTLIAQAGLPADYEARISGGGAKSPVWQQIIADVLGARLVNINTTEGGAFGAALLASVAAGWFADAKAACEALVQRGATVAVGADADVYAQRYEIYQSLYPLLKDTFARL